MTRAHIFRRRRLRGRLSGHVARGRPAMLFVGAPVLAVVLGSCVGVAAVATTYYESVRATMESPQDAMAARGGGARIYDRNGTLLYEFLDDQYGRQYPVKLGDISPLIQSATVAAEDASFYDNPGINVKGLARAGIENLKPEAASSRARAAARLRNSS